MFLLDSLNVKESLAAPEPRVPHNSMKMESTCRLVENASHERLSLIVKDAKVVAF